MQIAVQPAIQFIEQNAGPGERLRLRWLLTNQSPKEEELAFFKAGQHEAGGWSPFWAPGYASLDATCFHLAQASQMGLSCSAKPFLCQALQYLAKCQKQTGDWQEEESLADQAPHWVRPGDIAARLYLTANCAYWLSQYRQYQEHAQKAVRFLVSCLGPDGSLPSFPQAHWLAAVAFVLSGFDKPANVLHAYNESGLSRFSASDLAWLLCSYALLTDPPEGLIVPAIERLASLQGPDGRWQSDDGPPHDAHTTLEALYALSHFGKTKFSPSI